MTSYQSGFPFLNFMVPWSLFTITSHSMSISFLISSSSSDSFLSAEGFNVSGKLLGFFTDFSPFGWASISEAAEQKKGSLRENRQYLAGLYYRSLNPYNVVGAVTFENKFVD